MNHETTIGNKNKRQILTYLKSQKLAVISTVNSQSNAPESALIAFVEDENLCIYFQTGRHTRKAQNLQHNPNISMVFGLSLEDKFTIQFEGRAERLTELQEIQDCKKKFIDKDSPAIKYLENPTSIFYKIHPTWIGCSDYTEEKTRVFELFFS